MWVSVTHLSLCSRTDQISLNPHTVTVFHPELDEIRSNPGWVSAVQLMWEEVRGWREVQAPPLLQRLFFCSCVSNRWSCTSPPGGALRNRPSLLPLPFLVFTRGIPTFLSDPRDVITVRHPGLDCLSVCLCQKVALSSFLFFFFTGLMLHHFSTKQIQHVTLFHTVNQSESRTRHARFLLVSSELLRDHRQSFHKNPSVIRINVQAGGQLS